MADPLHIVICTTPDDVALVEPIAELLRAAPRRSVSIVHDEAGGVPWWEQVVGRIRSAGLFIVALSPAALEPTSSAATTVAAALAFARLCDRECLYVAVADLIPSLHRRSEPIETAKQMLLIGLGVAIS